jgi:hypothetical protein
VNLGVICYKISKKQARIGTNTYFSNIGKNFLTLNFLAFHTPKAKRLASLFLHTKKIAAQHILVSKKILTKKCN